MEPTLNICQLSLIKKTIIEWLCLNKKDNLSEHPANLFIYFNILQTFRLGFILNSSDIKLLLLIQPQYFLE